MQDLRGFFDYFYQLLDKEILLLDPMTKEVISMNDFIEDALEYAIKDKYTYVSTLYTQ